MALAAPRAIPSGFCASPTATRADGRARWMSTFARSGDPTGRAALRLPRDGDRRADLPGLSRLGHGGLGAPEGSSPWRIPTSRGADGRGDPAAAAGGDRDLRPGRHLRATRTTSSARPLPRRRTGRPPRAGRPRSRCITRSCHAPASRACAPRWRRSDAARAITTPPSGGRPASAGGLRAACPTRREITTTVAIGEVLDRKLAAARLPRQPDARPAVGRCGGPGGACRKCSDTRRSCGSIRCPQPREIEKPADRAGLGQPMTKSCRPHSSSPPRKRPGLAIARACQPRARAPCRDDTAGLGLTCSSQLRAVCHSPRRRIISRRHSFGVSGLRWNRETRRERGSGPSSRRGSGTAFSRPPVANQSYATGGT